LRQRGDDEQEGRKEGKKEGKRFPKGDFMMARTGKRSWRLLPFEVGGYQRLRFGSVSGDERRGRDERDWDDFFSKGLIELAGFAWNRERFLWIFLMFGGL